MELPFAGLHQLCAPMLGRLGALPQPQQAALGVALGLSSGPPPDRFLVALAALSLLSEVAAERPLLCLVDDAQWLDAASGQVLGFVARRLLGEFGLAGTHGLPGRIEESFLRRLEALPEETRLLLLVAAAEPVDDPLLVWRAAERLGIGLSAATADETEGLLVIGEHVAFLHPLVRTAVYRSASLGERRAVHRTLAQVTDAEVDADRRAWHLAAAAPAPDEEVAFELERSAGRAQARGGLAAAAAFLRRSVALTRDPARRVERALAAAQASLHAGSFDAALELLATAEAGMPDELQRARVDLLRGQVGSATAGTD